MSDTTTPADAFAERLVESALGWMEMMSIHLGSQLGWYDALAAGPLTAPELASRTSTSPRYAREWLEQQAASGILEVAGPIDAPGDERRYALPSAAAEVLVDRSSLAYTAPLARMLAAAGAQVESLVEAYRTGGGVSWEQLGVHAREAQGDMNRPWLEAVPEVFARHPRLHERLSRPGARIADVGMGEGWSSIALAKAYPQVQVDGFDVDAPSVEAARAHAEAEGVADRVRFHAADAASLAEHGPFDVAVAFECVHDMPDPQSVLAAMREATGDDGAVVIMDESVGDEFTPDTDGLDRLMYGYSLFICLPDGLSHRPSAGTGTVMRPSTLRGYAREAGFADIEIIEDGFGFWRFYELTRA